MFCSTASIGKAADHATEITPYHAAPASSKAIWFTATGFSPCGCNASAA